MATAPAPRQPTEADQPLGIGTSYAVGFSPDGALLATAGREVYGWCVGSRSRIWKSKPFSHPCSLAFSPDGAHLAVKNTAGRIVILDSRSGKVVVDFRNDDDGEGSNLLYSACGRYIVDGTWNGRLSVRCAKSGKHGFGSGNFSFLGARARQVVT